MASTETVLSKGYPGVYIFEEVVGPRPIAGVSTSTAVFIGSAENQPNGNIPVDKPIRITSYLQYEKKFGNPLKDYDLATAVKLFFLNGGSDAYIVNLNNQPDGKQAHSMIQDIFIPGAQEDTTEPQKATTPTEDDTFTNRYNEIKIKWIPNPEEDKVAYYRVYRDDSKIAETTNTYYYDRGPDFVNQTPKYQISAVDQASNEGEISDAVNLPANPSPPAPTDPDTGARLDLDPPEQVSNLPVTVISGEQIDLTWEAIPNAAGDFHHYNIYRNDIKIAEETDVATTTYQDIGLKSSTSYTYKVSAVDTSYNEGLTSNEESGTTEVIAGPEIIRFTSQKRGTRFNNLFVTIYNLRYNEETPKNSLFDCKIQLKSQDGSIIDKKEDFFNCSFNNELDDQYIENKTQRSELIISRVLDDTKLPAELEYRFLDGTNDRIPSTQDYKDGINRLDRIDIFNIMVITKHLNMVDDDYINILQYAVNYCEKRRAFLLIDPLKGWQDTNKNDRPDLVKPADVRKIVPTNYCALYYPNLNVKEFDPVLNKDYDKSIGPAAAIAGVFAKIDTQRGVWKAPAGLEAAVAGVDALGFKLTDDENGQLNTEGVNCLRAFPSGIVCWGARTVAGEDDTHPWKYISVRRLALFIEETLYRNTQWVVFEPNDEPLWAKIRAQVHAFMLDLHQRGAFQGPPGSAFFVRCDNDTTTPEHQELGIINIVVGFAPVKPAEFVVITVQRLMGQP
ncbi:MAG: phage tail sheath C-terminal domain-containing protein [Candidatus Hodarchaeales archaeon]|jgi:phage tail sheath protein FI